MKIRCLILVVAFVLTSFVGFAQKDSLIYFTPEVGLSYSQGEELSRVYELGGTISGGISFPVFKNKLRLNTNISFHYFGNNFSESTRDNLLFWNIGAAAELNSNVSKNINFVPYAGIFYLLGNNHLTPRKDFQGDRVDLFTHRGLGFDLGLKVLFESNVFIKVNFQLVTVDAEIDEQIKNDIEEGLEVNDALFNVVEIPSNEFSFNNLTFSIGYKIRMR